LAAEVTTATSEELTIQRMWFYIKEVSPYCQGKKKKAGREEGKR